MEYPLPMHKPAIQAAPAEFISTPDLSVMHITERTLGNMEFAMPPRATPSTGIPNSSAINTVFGIALGLLAGAAVYTLLQRRRRG